jgi:periplasmic protein TonB
MKPGGRRGRSGGGMVARLSSLLGVPACAWPIAASFGVHGAALLVALRVAAAPPALPIEERLVDVDVVVEKPPPEQIVPPPVPVAVEPQVRATPIPPPPAPAPRDVAPRSTSTADAPPPPVAQEAAPALTADEGMPHFTIAIGGGSGEVHGAVSATGTAHVAVVDAPVPEQSVSSRARCARGGTPPYPPAARADGVEGDVVLEFVLSTSGTVDSVRVVKGLGHGLDDAAVAAVRNWRCSPATNEGRPVRVSMRWAMQFRLQ